MTKIDPFFISTKGRSLMSKRNVKKKNRIVRDMKESFRALYLSAAEAKVGIKYPFKCDILTQINDQNAYASLMVEHDEDRDVINVNISTDFIVPSDRVAEVLKLLNFLNELRPLYQYSICPCCNEILVHASLYVSANRLSKAKFSRLIRQLLEDTYLFFPLIAGVIVGGNAEDLYLQFKDDHRNLMMKENTYSTDMETKILDDLRSVLADFYTSIDDDHRVEHGFVIPLAHPKDRSLPLLVATILDRENEVVVISMASTFPIPDDRLDVLMELVNRMNRICDTDHMYISHHKKNVALLKGVMLDNGQIDKEELNTALGTLMAKGFNLFPVINEQLSSNKNPSELMRNIMPCYFDKVTIH